MQFLRFGLAVFLFSSWAIFTGCIRPAANTGNGGKVPAASDPKIARTNVEELSLLVTVPYEVEDVVWKEDAGKRTLIAVLRFSPADSAKVVAEAEKFGAPQASVILPESWFPEELIAQSEMSGDSALKGLSYAANSFLQDPYSTGKLTRIDGTDYFVLEASATDRQASS